MATPIEIHHIEEVGSTQFEARRLAKSAPPGPLLVIARRQTKGRGRLGAEWVTAPRALACSLLLEPAWAQRHWSRIPLAAGLAARRALESVMGSDVSLKWPNDVMVSGAKVGGVLAEAEGTEVVIGLGVNLWWPDPPEGIAAVSSVDPGWAPADDIAVAWAHRLRAVLTAGADDWGHDEYRNACATLGTRITWDPDGEGTAVDVAEDGALIVQGPEGLVTLRSGDVRTVRPTTLAPGSVGKRGDATR